MSMPAILIFKPLSESTYGGDYNSLLIRVRF